MVLQDDNCAYSFCPPIVILKEAKTNSKFDYEYNYDDYHDHYDDNSFQNSSQPKIPEQKSKTLLMMMMTENTFILHITILIPINVEGYLF